MSWKSYNAVTAQGKIYGVKEDSFNVILELPTLTKAKFELALDAPPEVHRHLSVYGWETLPAADVSKTVDKYKKFIESSYAEFTTAKSAYVNTVSGWFSERSACYLASGTPVITQDTGFSDWLICQGGVHRFSNIDQALESIESVCNDYANQSKLARDVALEYFSHDKVLTDLLQSTDTKVPKALVRGSPAKRCLRYFEETADAIFHNIPGNEDFILMDDRLFGLFGEISRRKVFPFLERNGQYWGRPTDSAQAISEFIRLSKTESVKYAVLTKESEWWLSFYNEFFEFLDNFCEVNILSSSLRIYRVKE